MSLILRTKKHRGMPCTKFSSLCPSLGLSPEGPPRKKLCVWSSPQSVRSTNTLGGVSIGVETQVHAQPFIGGRDSEFMKPRGADQGFQGFRLHLPDKLAPRWQWRREMGSGHRNCLKSSRGDRSHWRPEKRLEAGEESMTSSLSSLRTDTG